MDLSSARWVKSSASGDGGASCVEVAVIPGDTALSNHKTGETELFVVRDSKDPHGPVLAFTPDEWQAFLIGMRQDEFTPEKLRG